MCHLEELGSRLHCRAVVRHCRPGQNACRRSEQTQRGEINRAIATPELRERLSAEALEPMPMSSAEFSAFIAAEVARWTKLVRERNIEVSN